MSTGWVQAEHDESRTASTDRHRAFRLGIGVGLLLSGIVLVALSGFAADHPVWGTLRATRGAFAALFMVGGVGLVLSRRTTPWRVLVLLLAAVFLPDQVGHLVRPEYGFAPAGSGWSVLGGCAVALGALTLPGRGSSHRASGRPQARKRWLTGIGAATATAALTAALAPVSTAVGDGVAADASTAEESAVPDVPARIEGTEAWRIDLTGVLDVTPGGAGFVLSHEDGVIAVDGTTGEERWHYRRPGAQWESTFVTPDGSTVLVNFQPDDRRRYVVLDAVTGQVRHQGVQRMSMVPWSQSAPDSRPAAELLTDAAFVRIPTSLSPTQLTAVSLTDGRELWRWSPPAGCWFHEHAWGAVTTGDRVVLTVACGSPQGDVTELRQYGLVDTTGEQAWDRVLEMPGRPADWPRDVRHGVEWPSYVERGPGDLISFSPDRFSDDVDNLVLDATDGTEIVRGPAPIEFLGPRIVVQDADGHVVLDPATGETSRWESDHKRLDQPCTRRNGLGLADQALCISRPESPADYGEHFALGGTLDRLLVTTDPSGVRERSLDVDLGGPFAVERGDEFHPEWLTVVAGPGAVAVQSEVPPLQGAPELVGLQ